MVGLVVLCPYVDAIFLFFALWHNVRVTASLLSKKKTTMLTAFVLILSLDGTLLLADAIIIVKPAFCFVIFLTSCFKVTLRRIPCFIGDVPMPRYLFIRRFLYPLYPARRTNINGKACCSLWTLFFSSLLCGII